MLSFFFENYKYYKMGSKKGLQHNTWIKYVNKYSITLAMFVIWISFIDKHNLMTQHRLKTIISEMEAEKVNYQKLYLEAIEEKSLLEKDQERYAREKYYMHKDNEEVFIIK
jgi:hypothetical protein